MRYFLLVYDRAAGELRELREYDSAGANEAMADRFARERRYRADPNIEVVVIGSASRHALRRTHGRYFSRSTQGLVDDLASLAG